MHEDQKSPRILGVIPARYNSSRFPGKPLAKIEDRTMLKMVYDKAKASKLDDILIATDDTRILDEVLSWNLGVVCVMTRTSHQSGTDRMFEAISLYEKFDGYINIQGDEPLMDPEDINRIYNSLSLYPSDLGAIITMVEYLHDDDFWNRNVVKAIVDETNSISGFFRSPIFYPHPSIFRHSGIYGMSHETMLKIKDLPQTENEKIEKLEQLRWMENGILMFCEKSPNMTWGIDTPEDLEMILNP